MKRDWCNKEFKVLFTFGASITAGGWSSSRDRCWASQLARLINEFQRFPVQLVNMGVGANVIGPKSTAYQYSSKPSASERVEKHILNYTANGGPLVPDLLVISYGLNDARGGTPVDLFCTELEDVLNRIRAKIDPLIVLVGPYHMTDLKVGGPEWSHADLNILNQYNDAVKKLATVSNCLFADILSAYKQADWLVHHDGVHANDLGHRLVANKIFEVLASNCSGLARETQELESYILPWRDESTLENK